MGLVRPGLRRGAAPLGQERGSGGGWGPGPRGRAGAPRAGPLTCPGLSPSPGSLSHSQHPHYELPGIPPVSPSLDRPEAAGPVLTLLRAPRPVTALVSWLVSVAHAYK